MIDVVVGPGFLVPVGCLINASFWLNNPNPKMSTKWSAPQRSCILVGEEGEVPDSE